MNDSAYLFEFITVGNYKKVSVVDMLTNQEFVITVPSTITNQQAMEHVKSIVARRLGRNQTNEEKPKPKSDHAGEVDILI